MSLKPFIKSAFIALAVLFFFAGTASAQDSLKTTEGRARAISQKMKTELSLSDDQYNKVYEINLKYAQQNETIRKSSDDRMAKMQAIKAGNEAKNNELKAVLTKEQFEEYKKMQKELREEAKEKMKERRNQ
ncbi:MAG: hypothetical protein ABW019_14690 [Chitinophagaceae bacterium]